MLTKRCLACSKDFKKKPNYSYNYWTEQRYCSLTCSGTLLKGKKQEKVQVILSPSQLETIQDSIDIRKKVYP